MSEALGVAGGTLTTTLGSWSSSCLPTSYTYQWQRSTDGGSTWSAISGATAEEYSPTGVDVEALDRAQVTGCNGTSCTGPENDSNSSAIYESALGLRPQYTATDAIAVDDQESLQVNVADGNLVLQGNDFSLPGVAGFGYPFTRTYNSLDNTGLSRASDLSTLTNPTMAIGWADMPSLMFFSNGDARYTGDGGYEITFPWNSATSTFTSPPGSDATLEEESGGPYYRLTFLRTEGQEVFYHDPSSGQVRLIYEMDRNLNEISFSYLSGVLSTVTDTTGRVTTFNYNGSGQLTSLTAPCSYANLSGSASTSGGSLATGTYYYEVSAIVGGTESTVTSEIAKAVTGPSGSVALTWHAVAGATSYRVYRGTTSGGENTYYTSTNTSYTDTGSTGTSASPPALSSTCTYSYTYNGSGELATYTDPLGATTTYGYNGTGLLSTVENPLGNEWSIAYNSQDQVSSITGGLNSSGSCPSGGVCPVTSFTYTLHTGATFCPYGMETDVTDPNSYVTTYCSDGRARVYQVEDPLGNATEANYGDLLSANDGGSNCADGNGETLDDQPCSTLDGLGYVTQYGYDSTGIRLVWEQNPLQSSSARSTWVYSPVYALAWAEPTSFTDANGHQTAYTYDSNGNPASTTTGLNSSGTCPSGTVCPRTDYIYASNGELQATKLGLDSTDACATNTPCSRTDNTYYTSNTASGTIGDLASTTAGLNLSDTCPSGATCPETTYTYDGAGNQTSTVDPLGNVSGGNPANYTQTSTYDMDGRPLSSTDELGNVTGYTYDGAGNELTTTDPKQHETKDVYDANNWLDSEQTGLNSSGTCNSGDTCPTTSYVYFANGDLNLTTDGDGNTTTDCYNGDHELTYEYSPLAGSVSCGASSNYRTSYTYDADGNELTVIDPLSHETKDSYSDGTTGAYAAVGELISEQSGLNTSGSCPASPAICPKTTYSYDLVGNTLTTLDPLNNETRDTYDADNRLSSEQSGLNSSGSCPTGTPTPICPTTSYTYDAEGNQATVKNARGYETAYTYDFAGNTLSAESGLNSSGSCPSGSTCPTTSSTYDADGNLATKTVPSAPSSPITYGYDHAGELTSTTYPSGYSTPNVYSAYDADGNQTSVTTGTSSCSTATVCDSYTYGNNDQMTADTTSDSSGTKSFSYTYDADGNVATDTYPDGTVVSSMYDADGNLCLVATASISSCSSNPASAHTVYGYDHADNLATAASITGSGTTVQTATSTYDSANVLTENKTIVGTAGSTIADVNYTLNNAGMPTTIARTSSVTTNGATINCTVDDHYDNNEHVTSAFWHTSSTCPYTNVTQSYTWDANGNRATSNNGSTTTNYAYNNLDELCDQTTGTASCSTPNYTYNANGDQTKDSSNNYYAYNLADQVCLASTSSSATSCTSTPASYTTYSYDGNGNLFETTPNGSTTSATRLLWDPNTDEGSQTAMEWTGSLTSGSVAHKYIYGQARLSETDPTVTGNPFYYTYDGLGSTLDVVNSSSTSKVAYSYGTFGSTSRALTGTTGVPGNLMQFISARADTATLNSINLYDTTARNLDTSIGSFTTQDPAVAPGETAGAYTYANDNPDTFADPSGNDAFAPLMCVEANCGGGGGGGGGHHGQKWVLPMPLKRCTAPGVTGGIDQGVDCWALGKVKAMGAGKIYHHSPPGSYRTKYGDGEAVYEHLRHGIPHLGFKRGPYYNIYYAEQKSLVGQGAHVVPGQPVMIAGKDELGFANNSESVFAPAGPLQGPMGGTSKTMQGCDFLKFLYWVGHQNNRKIPPSPPNLGACYRYAIG